MKRRALITATCEATTFTLAHEPSRMCSVLWSCARALLLSSDHKYPPGTVCKALERRVYLRAARLDMVRNALR